MLETKERVDRDLIVQMLDFPSKRHKALRKIEDIAHAKLEGKTKGITGDVQVANYVI